MKIQNTASPSFGTKINFIKSSKFIDIYSALKPRPIGYSAGVKPDLMTKSAFTNDIITCTGGIVNYGENFTLFHILHYLGEFVPEQFISSKAINIVLIGAAEKKPKSGKFQSQPSKLFEVVTEYFSEHNDNVSTLKHSDLAKSHIMYAQKTDTLFVYTDLWRLLKGINIVDNVNMLKEAFTEISIARCDDLLIDGVEVKRSDYPELFKPPAISELVAFV